MDKKIVQLTELMQNLALLICILQSKADTLSGNPRPITIPIISNFLKISRSMPSQKLNWPKKITKFAYFWAKNHYLKRHYFVF